MTVTSYIAIYHEFTTACLTAIRGEGYESARAYAASLGEGRLMLFLIVTNYRYN